MRTHSLSHTHATHTFVSVFSLKSMQHYDTHTYTHHQQILKKRRENIQNVHKESTRYREKTNLAKKKTIIQTETNVCENGTQNCSERKNEQKKTN